MGAQGITGFIDKIDGSADLQAKAQDAFNRFQEQIASARTSYYHELVKTGKDAGFDFTADDVDEHMRAVCSQVETGELSDDQLEAVAGGIRAGYAAKFSKLFQRQTSEKLQNLRACVKGVIT